ncbi:MAG: YncE family protein, partial [Armatimonadota bacterium]
AGLAKDKRYETDPVKLVLKVTKAGVTTTIDTSSVTAGGTGAAPANLPGYAPPSAGPSAPLLVGDRLFFTVPAAGRVGVVDTKTDKVIKVLEVGGCPVDLATAGKGEKVYVADAATSTVLVVDAAKLELTARISVAQGPTSLQVAEAYNLQRPNMVPGLPINRLFVACSGGKAIDVIDLKTDKLIGSVPLGYAPRNLKAVPSPNPDWWPTLADDRIPFGMLPKLAVEPMPVTLDLATGEATAATTAAEGIARRNAVKLTVGGAEKTITSNGNMVLQIAAPVGNSAPPIGQPATPPAPKNIDCSSLCDPQRGAQAALRAEDQTGSITVSIDGGPDFDWRSGLWTRPDNGGFLVFDTEEYWQWNAPRFRVKPGDHVVTIKVKDEAVRLDALAVEPTAEGALEVSVRPEPWSMHSAVPSGVYQGVFYDTEPVKFSVGVVNGTAQKQSVTVSGSVTNTMGVLTALLEAKPLEVEGASASSFPLALDLKETGRFTLTLTAHSEGGDVTRDFRFVRVPKLEHPRLFFRADQEQAIRQRIAAHPVLFKRYAEWLVRMTAKEGKFPDRFLPNGLTQAELALAAPEGSKNPGQEWGWRMYELGWRMMGVQFASRYVPGADQTTLDARLKPLLTAPLTNTWVQYHHHGPFFPGAVEGMVDMAPAEQRAGLPLTGFFAKHKGDMNVYPFTLMSLEEPLTPQDRALIYRIAMQHDNFESYFTAHAGNRGGTWWQNPWSWCYCPTQGLFLSEMFTANFLGERQWAQKPFFRGYLTFMEQADPMADKASLLPALRRPSGEPWRFILTAAARHPLEKAEYGWDEWLRKMEGPLPNEGQAVDELMALKGMPLAGPLEAAPHRFATAISVPVALALGWYDPKAPTVEWKDLPPTTILNPEGWARLRSGWTKDDTELWFMSGVRDHTTRHQPNNFMIARPSKPETARRARS